MIDNMRRIGSLLAFSRAADSAFAWYSIRPLPRIEGRF